MPPDITFFFSFSESVDTPEFLSLLICQATNISHLYVLNGDFLAKLLHCISAALHNSSEILILKR
ncbi:hypothetical protein DMA48_06355 [Salmonella enterica subsp. enterica serovar Kirkee]|nr:hypothetical protein [Salmonella enterica subsp. enterica serovar Kirkee]